MARRWSATAEARRRDCSGGWHSKSLEAVCARYGNGFLCSNYLEVCRELFDERAAAAGYVIERWTGYYCGHLETMTHYAAVLGRI